MMLLCYYKGIKSPWFINRANFFLKQLLSVFCKGFDLYFRTRVVSPFFWPGPFFLFLLSLNPDRGNGIHRFDGFDASLFANDK